jgi:D-3-phosphoglycerate dehydrogenase / 2-oxoglutarate reductase
VEPPCPPPPPPLLEHFSLPTPTPYPARAPCPTPHRGKKNRPRPLRKKPTPPPPPKKTNPTGVEQLKAQGAEVDCAYDLTPEQLLVKIATADALIVRSATKVTRAVFEAAKGRLKVVGRAGVGVDNVDLTAATEHGCLVVNAPTANTVAAAEHGVALLCSLARNVAQADASIKQGKWERSKFVGVSMVDKTLAIIGFGKVGSEVARRCRGLGMTVLAYDPFASEEKARAVGVRLVTLDEALAAADFFSLHMPLTPGTKNMFNDDAFAKMKKGARVVNVARGGVIDEAALARALDSGIVAAAALDVFQEEPPKFDGHPLVGRANVVCTPHLGASTQEAQEGVAIEVVEAVVDALAGRLSSTAVNAPMIPAEMLKELAPFVTLAEGLGRAAVSLVASETGGGGTPRGTTGGGAGFSDISITYTSARGDDLDTRLLRAMVIKGILEATTTANVNLVNADLLAKQRGLRVAEVTVRADTAAASNGTGSDVLSSLSVALGTKATKFSAAVDKAGRIYVEGAVRNGAPHLTKIGTFDADLSLYGSVILCRQQDQPGIVGAVGSLLGDAGCNISFMVVGAVSGGGEALMAIGVDSEPSREVADKIGAVKGITEVAVFTELSK